MKVKNVMVRNISAVTRTATVREAMRTMSSHRVSGLPVVDDNQIVIGFISEKDIVETVYPYAEVRAEDLMLTAHLADLVRELHSLGGRLVGDCMTEPAITTTEDEDLEDLAATMLSHGLKIVPVVRDGRLVGVMRRRDLAAELIEEGEPS